MRRNFPAATAFAVEDTDMISVFRIAFAVLSSCSMST